MSEQSIPTKKNKIVMRTFAGDLERERANRLEKKSTKQTPRPSTQPVPKINLRLTPHATVTSSAKDSNAITVTKPVEATNAGNNPAHITLRTKPSIPKPTIVTPSVSSKPLSLILPPTPSTQKHSSVVQPVKTSDTKVVIGDEETSSEATIITDTKHKRFSLSRSISASLRNWVRGLGRTFLIRNQTTDSALPVATSRQEVINRATTISGVTATARDSSLTARIQNRPTVAQERAPKYTVPRSTPTLQQTVIWTPKTEPGFALLENKQTIEETPVFPVRVTYRTYNLQNPQQDTVTEVTKPVMVTPRTYIPPPDLEAEQRWNTVNDTPDTPGGPAEVTSAQNTEHLELAQALAEAEEELEQIATVTELTSLPDTPSSIIVPTNASANLATNHLSAEELLLEPETVFPSSEPEITRTSIKPTINSSSYSTEEAEVATTSTQPAYVKRSKKIFIPPVSNKLQAILMGADTNILTLAIVGALVGVGVLGVGFWLLISAFTL